MMCSVVYHNVTRQQCTMLLYAEVCDASRHACGDSLEGVQKISQARAKSHRGVHCIPQVQGAFAQLFVVLHHLINVFAKRRCHALWLQPIIRVN